MVRFSSSTAVPDMTGWTVDQVMQESIRYLAVANVSEPELSVQHLLADSLQLSWKSGFRDVLHERSTVLTAEQATDYHDKLHRRSNHEPLQYIVGQWDFLDYTIVVKSPLLCPRPETEELVDLILKEQQHAGSSRRRPIRILDVGCGTGVIGLALAEQLDGGEERACFVQAIDIDPVAIATSLENAQRILGVVSRTKEKKGGVPGSSWSPRYRATLCSAQDYECDPDAELFDLVVSNPPYIPRGDMNGLSEDVIRYENEDALCGGDDGMDVIRTIVMKLRTWCRSGAICWMEVDPTHPRLIEDWLTEESDKWGVSFEAGYRDMFGKDRFVKLRVL